MRIGIDARMYSSAFTGIGRYVYELTQRLFEMDHENEYVLFMNDPHFDEFQPPNDRVKKVRVNAHHYSWAEQTSYCRTLNREKLDLMHFTHFNAPILYRRPSVVTIHDLTLSYFPGKKMTSPIHRMAYHWVLGSIVRRSKQIIAVSENTKVDLMKLLKVSTEKVSVIYEGVAKEFTVTDDLDFMKEVSGKYGIINEFLLYTGVWRSHKNIVGLIQAFARLREDPKFDGQLVITGREDPFYPEVKEAIKGLGLEDHVILTGLVDEKELIALYNGATVYVLPSFYEGFGLSPLESMSCGTPVAASNTSCIPEVCGDENALFFDPENIEDMTKVIGELWFDEDLQEKLRRQGLRRVNDFSWEKMTKRTFALYTKALKS